MNKIVSKVIFGLGVVSMGILSACAEKQTRTDDAPNREVAVPVVSQPSDDCVRARGQYEFYHCANLVKEICKLQISSVKFECSMIPNQGADVSATSDDIAQQSRLVSLDEVHKHFQKQDKVKSPYAMGCDESPDAVGCLNGKFAKKFWYMSCGGVIPNIVRGCQDKS